MNAATIAGLAAGSLVIILLIRSFSKFDAAFRFWRFWTEIAILSALSVLITFSVHAGKTAAGKPQEASFIGPDADVTRKISLHTDADKNRAPNIIVLLSEAFWDPTLMKNVSFSRDPIPFFHYLQQHFTNGWMLSSQFGGGTANVEFEVLTGHSMRFLPEASIAYETVVDRPVDSLARILRKQGYTTTAISPFYNWYFKSKEVYRFLGFSTYISLEFFPPDYAGPYIADRAVVKKIVEESEKSPGPDFIFANTMENHYHYWPDKFKENTIEVKGNISGEARGLLQTLAQGLSGADRAMQTLVEHFAKSNEPTIIVLFGDHLPYLEKDYQVYRETKYLLKDDPDLLQKMYSVPVIVWNNYLPDQKETLHFNPSFLGPYLLKTAGRQGTFYTDYLYALSQTLPIIPPPDDWPKMRIDEAKLREYRERQERMLSLNAEQATADRYVLGYEDISIARALVDRSSANAREILLRVKGRHFGLGSLVYLNETQLPTEWISDNELTAKLPVKWNPNEADRFKIQVRVIDSKKNELARTNIVELAAFSAETK